VAIEEAAERVAKYAASYPKQPTAVFPSGWSSSPGRLEPRVCDDS